MPSPALAPAPNIRAAQQALTAAGFSASVDGTLGPQTTNAIKAFQRAKSLPVDGTLNAATLAALGVTDSFVTPTTAAISENEKQTFAKYAAMVRAAGGEVNPGGQPTVLGLRRGADAMSTAFGDRLVVLQPNGRVVEFTASTKPSSKGSADSKDANGDGKKDVAILQPGNYRVRPWKALFLGTGLPAFHVQTLSGNGEVPAWRDTNQDGTFTAAEKVASARRGDIATEILFHAGKNNGPSSVGCITLSPAQMKRFAEVLGGPQAAFTFTLVADARA